MDEATKERVAKAFSMQVGTDLEKFEIVVVGNDYCLLKTADLMEMLTAQERLQKVKEALEY